jgi:hypothetical protein
VENGIRREKSKMKFKETRPFADPEAAAPQPQHD